MTKIALIRQAIFFILIFFTISMSHAVTINWPDRSYGVLAQGQKLSDVLKSFSDNYQMQAEISPHLTEEVNARIPSAKPARFLSKLKEMYAFSWYYDGAKLYFYAPSETRSEVLYLRSIDAKRLRKTLLKLNILDGDYYWQEIEGEGLVYISGTPRMLELVGQTASVLDSKVKEESYEMRIFQLRYASAADQKKASSQGGGYSVPGVVSLLRNAIAETSIDDSASQTNAITEGVTEGGYNKSLTGLRGQGLAKETGTQQKQRVVNRVGRMASISADVRLNAVVIYDHPGRMPMYEQLISELDRPIKQVEISVTVMNVTVSNLKALGIDWRYSDGTSSFGYGASDSGLPGEGQIGLITGTADLFLATLTALESKGKATISSRPQVVTGDNLEAVLDSSTTFYVRVAGEEEVDLFPVSVGSVLRVTPHIINEGLQRRVRLDVNIQDGNETGDTVDSIPTVASTSISTQAIVNDQEGLLLGGYYYDTETESNSSVPFLSAIPIFGNLFKTKSKQVINYSKIFMITPRVLDPVPFNSKLAQ